MKTALHVPSTTSCRRRSRSASFVLKALPSALALVFSQAGGAVDIVGTTGLPQAGTVNSGTVTSALSTDGNLLTINQATERAVIDWSSFNIDVGKTVHFAQALNGAVLNKVSGSSDPSQILGTLSATGTVMLMNPNGVMFGPGSTVNVGSLIATTGTINESSFTQNSAQISGATRGVITNQGTITAQTGGLVALVAPSVINQHVISATGGTIALLGTNAATISLNGGLYEFAIPGSAPGTEVSNAAGASLNAATIHLGVGDAANVLSGVINLEGVQQATSAIVVNGHTVALKSALEAPSVSGNAQTVNVSGDARIQDGVNIARTGGTVNVAAGTYVQPSTLKIAKSLTLSGAGEGATTIDARGVTDYGIHVTGDNVTLKDFTLYGPTANVSSSYGIKVAPAGGTSARLRDFAIRNVTIRGSGRAELDLNGVVGAQIDRVTADGAPVGNNSGSTAGAGIQVTDSANVTISNSTTRNNQWGGLALYQANRYHDQQVNNITVEASNSFTERNPVYLQDQSASLDFGTLSIEGFAHAVRNNASTDSRQYTWLQASQQKAFDFAVNVPVSPESSYVQGWTGGAVTTQNFQVGTGNLLGGGTQAMSIGTAVGAAATGAAVDVYAGTYAEQLTLNKAGLTLTGHEGARIVLPTLTGNQQLNAIKIEANNTTVSGFDIAGRADQSYVTYAWGDAIDRGIAVDTGVTGFTISNNNIHDVRNGILINGGGGSTGVVSNNTIDNTKSAVSVQYTDGRNIAMTGNRQGGYGNEWGVNLHLNGFENPGQSVQDAPTLAWQQSLLALSAGNNGWSVQDQGYRSSNRTHVAVAESGLSSNQGSLRAPLNTVQAGVNAVVTGGTVNVAAGDYSEVVNITKALTLDGAGMGQTRLKAPTANENAVTVEASGVTLSDMSISDSYYGVHVKGTSNNLTINRVAFNNNKYSVRGASDVKADNFRMLNSSISGGLIGFQTYNGYDASTGGGKASFKNALFENVTVDGTSYKGFYFETADNLTMRNVTITNAGNVGDPTTHEYGSAIDVNLKHDDFSSLTFDNVVIKDSGHSSGTPNHVAFVIKTRGIPGDAAYAAAPASLQSVNIMGGSIEGSLLAGSVGSTGLRLETLSNGQGGQPTVTISGGTQFKNNGTDIAVGLTNVDARDAVFVGAAGDGFAIEDRVKHALDDSGRGLVTWEAGKVYVTQNSGSIQRGVDAAGIGDTVNVANASFAENVTVDSRRNLAFNDTRLQSLKLNSGAAGSGIGGAVTAQGAGGFEFDANVNLLADTTLTTLGADIKFKKDIQNAGDVARALRLVAGSGGTRGNVYMNTGGSATGFLGQFDVSANNFTLDSTLWVSGYKIDALGDVALSPSTLRAQDAGAASTLNAGGDVTGATNSLGSVAIVSGGDIVATITAQDVVARAQGKVDVVLNVSNSATFSSGGETNVAGSAPQLSVDAPSGSVSGSFGQVNNTGSGLIHINGKPQGNQTLSSNSENNRVVPAGEVGAQDGQDVQLAQAEGVSAQNGDSVVWGTPETAGDAIDSGQSVQLDLSPRSKREKQEDKDKAAKR